MARIKISEDAECEFGKPHISRQLEHGPQNRLGETHFVVDEFLGMLHSEKVKEAKKRIVP